MLSFRDIVTEKMSIEQSVIDDVTGRLRKAKIKSLDLSVVKKALKDTAENPGEAVKLFTIAKGLIKSGKIKETDLAG
jgi:ethanolamine utilization protein EutQ (cupin superfamily)